MPNRNGQGPIGSGSKTGRGRGLCNTKNASDSIKQETNQASPENQQISGQGCRGPKGCGTGLQGSGKGAGQGRKNGGCGNGNRRTAR